MNRLLILLTCVGAILSNASAANTKANRSNADYQAIQARTAAWIDGAAQGDLEGYFDFITDDFVWLGDMDGPGFSGHDSLRKFLSPFFESFRFSVKDIEPVDIAFSADGITAVHQYIGTAGIKSKETGETAWYKRRYVDFWRKGEDGLWRCSRHLYLVID